MQYLCVVYNIFFNDTDTTETYTYRHTHSPHDALPISTARGYRSHRSQPSCSTPPTPTATGTSSSRTASPSSREGWTIATVTAARRSEEHTSELQSLMRISYAVFCLKKKKHK